MITVKDIQKAKRLPARQQGRAAAACASAPRSDVGATPRSASPRWCEAGVDVIVVDTAHGHSQGVLDTRARHQEAFPELQVIAGNIATADAAHGADRLPARTR